MLEKLGRWTMVVLFIFGIIAPTIYAADTIKVGIVLPITGPQAKFGEIERLSFEMAVEEINAKGGVQGKMIELLIEDDTGKPDVGRSAAEKLISQNKVVMLGGGYSSSVTYYESRDDSPSKSSAHDGWHRDGADGGDALYF
jgi:branched-chain amino acid transport system substrate-binding protein